jgi:hypothetical protein
MGKSRLQRPDFAFQMSRLTMLSNKYKSPSSFRRSGLEGIIANLPEKVY